jgi:RNA polymerase sigma-70 factor, ECF subfamily
MQQQHFGPKRRACAREKRTANAMQFPVNETASGWCDKTPVCTCQGWTKMAKSLRALSVRTKKHAESNPVARRVRFERWILPHVDAARKLARWRLHDSQDAEDVVQEALLRALQFYETFDGSDGRKWLFAIVRNCCHNHLRRARFVPRTSVGDRLRRSATSTTVEPLSVLLQSEEAHLVHEGLAELPVEYQIVVALRDLDQMSYREIAYLLRLPVGTVMSRLARGRLRLRQLLIQQERTGSQLEAAKKWFLRTDGQ